MLLTVVDYKKFVRQFQILQKNNLKIQILKLLKDQKILKNQMIHCLKIIKKMSYIQKNNS